MRKAWFRSRSPESGMTLTELMIAVILLGIGMGWIVTMFLQGWNLWKRNFDELILQRNTRLCMKRIVQATREAQAGTIVISKAANGPPYSEIAFIDGRKHYWIFRQNGAKVTVLMPLASGISTTQILISGGVQSLTFAFPNLSTKSLVDVALTARTKPYQKAVVPIVIQLAERVMVRNP